MSNREKYTHRTARDHNERDYDLEAKHLLKGLKMNQLYELYEICIGKSKAGQLSEKRHKEVVAVMKAIEKVRDIDREKLSRMKKGRSEMAEDAREKDGRTTVNRKKV